LFVMSQRPATLVIEPDRAGFATVARVDPEHPELDLFVGLIDPQLDDAPVWDASESQSADPARPGSYLSLARTRGRWRIRSREVVPGTPTPAPRPGTDLMALIPSGGSPVGLADLTEQAGAAFGSD